jgi:vitamin B12/bleomycin/antimicrobial peptide transport system ATP-binding/permease protein
MLSRLPPDRPRRGNPVAVPTSNSSVRGSAAIFLRLVTSYWAGASRVTAWILSSMLLGLVLASVTLQAQINSWNARFFDALEKRAQGDIAPLLWQFAGFVVIAGVIMAVTVLVRMYLMVQLRRWVTTLIYTHWLDSHAYLRLDRTSKGAQTPEFRIADDVRLALDQLADLAVGFFTSLLLAITFFEVLARVGGSLMVDALGGVTVPAYFLVGAVLYAICLSGLTSLLGYPLIGRIQRKNHLEGEFRYELMKVREEAKSISTNQEEPRRAGILAGSLEDLVHQWQRVLLWQSQVVGVASSNAVLVGVFPVILAIPKYMSGEMTLGAVMQLATAFVQVQLALNWIVDNFVRLAELRASANRVGELVAAMDDHVAAEAAAEAAAMPSS